MRLIFLGAIVLASVSMAEAQVYSAAPKDCVKPKCIAPIASGDGFGVTYPKELRALGVQGTTVLSFTVGADGVVSDLVVDSPSRSETLDRNLVDAVSAHMFQPGKIDGRPVAMRKELSVDFRKDDLSNLRLKTCADLTVDIAYFQKTFPELPIEQMWVSKLSQSLLNFGGNAMSADAKTFVEQVKRTKAAFGATAAWCASNPDALYLARFKQEAS